MKKIIVPAVLAGLVLGLFLSPGLFAQDKKQAKTEERVFIPKEVKAVMQEGLAARQGRQDIPFSIVNSVYLPAQQALHTIFYFKIKNSDLGFIPVGTEATPPAKPQEKPKEEKKAETPPAFEPAPPAYLQSSLNIFLQFNLLKDGQPAGAAKEVYVPCNIQTESDGYDPEKEDIYFIGYPLAPGEYLLSAALTSPDLKKIGICYYQFSLPDASTFTSTLETTPIFFVKEMKQVEAAETRTIIHKGFFTYSVLQVTPNLGNVFTAGDNLDIFYYIFGTQPNEQKKYDIEITYEVLQDDKPAIRYETAGNDFPLESRPLPMKQTVIKKTEKGEEREIRDLLAGNYVLTVKILDKISNKSLIKKVDFEVK